MTPGNPFSPIHGSADLFSSWYLQSFVAYRLFLIFNFVDDWPPCCPHPTYASAILFPPIELQIYVISNFTLLPMTFFFSRSWKVKLPLSPPPLSTFCRNQGRTSFNWRIYWTQIQYFIPQSWKTLLWLLFWVK